MASNHFAWFQNFCNFILVKYIENIEDFIECILEKKAIDFGKSKHYKGSNENILIWVARSAGPILDQFFKHGP